MLQQETFTAAGLLNTDTAAVVQQVSDTTAGWQ